LSYGGTGSLPARQDPIKGRLFIILIQGFALPDKGPNTQGSPRLSGHMFQGVLISDDISRFSRGTSCFLPPELTWWPLGFRGPAVPAPSSRTRLTNHEHDLSPSRSAPPSTPEAPPWPATQREQIHPFYHTNTLFTPFTPPCRKAMLN